MSLDRFKWLYMNLSGRIDRKIYWLYFFVPGVFFSLLFSTIIEVYGEDLARIFLIFFLPIIFMILSGHIKRQHDLGGSGWWVILGLVPIVGVFYSMIYLGLKKSQNTDNVYGKFNEINKGEECQH